MTAATSAPQRLSAPPSLPVRALQNRFVGEWLLHATPAGRAGAHAVALGYAARGHTPPLALGHGVEGVKALGRDAVRVGNAGRDHH